ncbi:MAG: glycosyltransferase [Nocardiopsaceae bacterium]|nr:glycosyltransferase [Nocardiopsaceae bacterium]
MPEAPPADATAIDDLQPVSGQPVPGRQRRSQVAAPANLVNAPLTRSDLVRIPANAAADIVLPVPPSDDEKYSYIRRHIWILTLAQILTFPPLVYSQIRMFMNSPWFLCYAPFVLLGIITFFVSLIADGFGKGFDLDAHKKIVARWFPLWYPSVDVFLPVCGEPIELLRNTWTHVAALRATYNGKLTPYVLDDGASPVARALAREFGFAYATRPDRGWYKKSGNLKYGFEISDGEFILLLDADFAPRPDLLDETLPYFALFGDVGIVQTPQYFHVDDRQTWVERGGGAIQELFYRAIQTTRVNKAGAICVGSCAVYRREALAQNGGMSLAEHSEDLHTGFDLHQLGWRMAYLPIALSTGTCPDNILAFLNQQYRWCSGTFSLMQGSKFWRARMSWYTRMCYLSGIAGYFYTAIFTFIGPALMIGMLAFVPTFLHFATIVMIAPVLFYAGVIYPLWHRSPYRLEAWSVRLLAGWAHVFAIWDMMRGRLRGWQPSGSGAKRQDGRRRLWAGLIGWSFGTAAVWAFLALWRMMTMDSYDFYLTFALGVFQLAVIGRVLIQPRESS